MSPHVSWIRRLASALLLFVFAGARADSWSYPPELVTKSFDHGEVHVVLTTDARRNQKMPEFLLEIYTQGVRVAQIPGISFEQLFSSDDNRLFVGLSNRGIPGTAVVVFNALGTLAVLANHGLAEFDYCSKSITLQREWFDEDNPSVSFRLGEQEKEPGIFLRSCTGTTIELLRTVREAYARAARLSESR